ncbi:hypothetical protein ACNVED_13585 [Legionella sp. D16C41]|uniref:hypothetical protein n=1 Tax=Legionella sp. D16C41 TaxID=3402688 RepID=UPI003AF7948E
MSNKVNYILQTLIPFLIIGIAIAMLIGLLILFSYILVWGIFVGAILWLAAIIKNFLFPKKVTSNSDGRIIEHDDKK